MARVNPHRKDLKKKGRDSDDEVPNVHVAWMPKDQEVGYWSVSLFSLP